MQQILHPGEKQSLGRVKPLTQIALSVLIKEGLNQNIQATLKELMGTHISIYNDIKKILSQMYVDWLSANPMAPIIVNQTGLEVFEKMGFLESNIPEEWKQLPIDISKYIILDSPIKDWQNRPWTTEYLVENEFFPPPHDEVLVIGMTGVSILNASKIPGADTVDQLNCAEGNLSYIVPGSFNLLNRLTELYLYNNHLRSIASGTFDGLTALRILNLDGNDISSIASGVFAPLLKLNVLSLNENPKLKLNKPDELAAIKIERPEWFTAP